jgi:hypothetical protein
MNGEWLDWMGRTELLARVHTRQKEIDSVNVQKLRQLCSSYVAQIEQLVYQHLHSSPNSVNNNFVTYACVGQQNKLLAEESARLAKAREVGTDGNARLDKQW